MRPEDVALMTEAPSDCRTTLRKSAAAVGRLYCGAEAVGETSAYIAVLVPIDLLESLPLASREGGNDAIARPSIALRALAVRAVALRALVHRAIAVRAVARPAVSVRAVFHRLLPLPAAAASPHRSHRFARDFRTVFVPRLR